MEFDYFVVSKEDHSGKAGLVNEAKDLFDSIGGNSSNPADKEVELTTTGQWFRMIYDVKLGVVPPKVSRSLRIKLPSQTYFRVAVMVARENDEIPTGLHLDVRDLEPQAAFYISEENGTFYLTDANDNTFKSSRMLPDEKLVVK
ncbi:hypothetical protein SELMODRAFT_414024 [Selaginella moellendorffii]|uniref:Uncharacterized protein n=1 Tax=Selaginella moellendorffii TaxID=88036 RepID=D8RRD6_SELML|nr:hypothetical protein SELMODRAFT_414024 [Selaginella moellendorffii]